MSRDGRNFTSDNVTGVAPAIMEAVLAANRGRVRSYGDDPITARGNATLEEDRLRTLILVNLANVDRGFLPGSITGKPLSNTPSLRGIWRQVNFLRHGLARSFAEVVLPPGHKALQDGELGYAVEAVEGKFNVHGNTADLPEADVKALNLYLQTIE